MKNQQMVPGKQVRARGRLMGQLHDPLVVEAFPVRGLYHDYARCRSRDRIFFFRPDELSVLQQ